MALVNFMDLATSYTIFRVEYYPNGMDWYNTHEEVFNGTLEELVQACDDDDFHTFVDNLKVFMFTASGEEDTIKVYVK